MNFGRLANSSSRTLYRRSVRWAVFAAITASMFSLSSDAAYGQGDVSSGQNVGPIFEGWEENPDGSYHFVFGYINRNWEESVDVPIGPNNHIEPGGPDRGQPTHFLPRRNRVLFRV